MRGRRALGQDDDRDGAACRLRAGGGGRGATAGSQGGGPQAEGLDEADTGAEIQSGSRSERGSPGPERR